MLAAAGHSWVVLCSRIRSAGAGVKAALLMFMGALLQLQLAGVWQL